ncbi:hypothetical protein [Actinoplanes italicus]|uniref:hypothetical protein n=1 Tax=Actinoplanes italicus TaxID=113567 RepID=UPI000D061E86|nr:hypothetical protein [Actinoplanes italicus]
MAKSAPAPGPLTQEQALAQARKSGRSITVDSATTPTDLVTANPNGTLTLTRSLAPARKRVAGKWKDLDATLVRNPDGSLSPAVSTTPVVLSGGGTGPLAKLSGAGQSFELGAPMKLPKPSIAGDTATYAGVLPGVDLEVRATKFGGFSEVFVVRDAAAAADPALKKLTLSTKAKGLKLTEDKAGNLVGKDRAGRTVLTAPTPVMWDSAPPTPAASRKLAGLKGAGNPAEVAPESSSADGPGISAKVAPLDMAVAAKGITLNAEKLLKDPAAKYPIYIDPEFNWQSSGPTPSGWATVAEQFPGTNYWKDTTDPNNRLQVGYSPTGYNGLQIKARTLLNFTVPVSLLKDATISSAVINMTNVWSYNCTASTINMYAPSTDLTSGNATWNAWDGVSLGSAVQSKSFAHGYNSSCPAKGEAFVVTSTIANDVKNNNTTRTFMLKAGSESDVDGWKKFDLSTVKMTILYNHRPNIPTGLKTSPTTSCSASPSTAIGDGPVKLFATVSDPNKDTMGLEFKLWKTSDTSQTALATSNMKTFTAGNNTTPVMDISPAILRTASGVPAGQTSGGTITEFSWKIRTTDYAEVPSDTSHHSKDWSPTCKFRYDPTRTGAPGVTVVGAQIGRMVTINITRNEKGTAPAGYLVQLNGGAPISVSADASGNATAQVVPTRFTNIVAVTSKSAAGNIGETGTEIFNAAPAKPAQPDDLTGDDFADVVAVGGGNDLPPGLWVAGGENNGQVAAFGTNIGVYGNGTTGTKAPASYNGAQVVTGAFTGNGMLDVMVYYPTGEKAGSGSVIGGNGDGSVLLPDSGNQFTVTADKLLEFSDVTSDYVPDSQPAQITGVGDIIGYGDVYPDLLGIAGNATAGHHLNYYITSGPASFQFPYTLTTATPTGGSDWNNWTIAATRTSAGTEMYLWNRGAGALYLWRNLDFTTGELTYTQHTIATSGWRTTAATLQAADIDRDGDADLWTIGSGATVTAHLLSDLNGTPKVTAQPNQTMATGNHLWLLNDAETGVVGSGAAKDVVGTMNASGTSAGGTATAATSWDTGDLFSPSVELNGADVAAASRTGYLTTAARPIRTDTDFTVSVWAKPLTGGTVLSLGGANTAALKLWADPSDQSWRAAMSHSDVTSPGWDTAIAPAGSATWGVWSQITVTYNATYGTLMLYLNGSNAGQAIHNTKWTPGSGDAGLRIGSHRSGSGTATAGYFGGKISNVQTWNKVWTRPAPIPSAAATTFATGMEPGEPRANWRNTVDIGAGHGAAMNVGGVCCSLTGPELATSNSVAEADGARTGTGVLFYSGKDNDLTYSYAYLKAFDLRHLTLRRDAVLSYWIYPQSTATSGMVSGSNSTCVAIDLVYTDGTNLRDSSLVDQRGNRAHPAYQCGKLTLDTWNEVVVPVGTSGVGKQIETVTIGYDQPANTGGYRGFIDDIKITNVVSAPQFFSGSEAGEPALTWLNSLVATNTSVNVGGICCNLPGAELVGTSTPPGGAHTGTNTVMYSGKDLTDTATSSYAYTRAYQVNSVPITPTTKLRYWIWPQSTATSSMVSGSNSTCVALDLGIVDQVTGTTSNLRDSMAVDQTGDRAHPAYQCNKLTMDTWNEVVVPLGGFGNGKLITQINVGYDQPANTGGYRGFIDDVRISE